MTAEEFPEAEVVSPQSQTGGKSAVSKMWLATLACLLGAIALVWYSLEPAGTKITLRFQEGHGLKPGDALRNLGIDVGRVVSVELNKDLAGVEVHAELAPAATALAREGTRFWIVRPTVDVTGVSGLDTAVGSKYIAVAQGTGERSQPQFEFTGLETAPFDGTERFGLELILRSAQRFGINPGAPLTWRGVEVGRVLSCALSPDSQHVDIRVQINATHQRLVTSATRFWVLSGVKLDAGLTGLKFSADSLATIVRGGIGLITPTDKEAQPARAGDIYTLFPEEDESWTKQAAAINLLQLTPPKAVLLAASWQEKILGFTRSAQRHSLGVPVINEKGQLKVLIPADFIQVPSRSIEGSFKLAVESDSKENQLQELATPSGSEGEGLLVKLPLPAGLADPVPEEQIRITTEPEDCFAVRQLSNDDETLLESIGRHELSATPDRWMVRKPQMNSAIWQGAPILSALDGKFIGVLVSGDDGVFIVPLK